MSSRAYEYLDRAVNELRRAAEEHAESGQGRTLDADAIHDLVRTAEGMRERLAASPAAAGERYRVPVQSLVVGDRLLSPDGTREIVTSVARHPYAVDISTDGAISVYTLNRNVLVEVSKHEDS